VTALLYVAVGSNVRAQLRVDRGSLPPCVQAGRSPYVVPQNAARSHSHHAACWRHNTRLFGELQSDGLIFL